MDNPTPPRRAFKCADGHEWCLKLDNLIMDELKSAGLLDIDEFEREPEIVLGKLVDGNREWLPKVLCVVLNEQREKKTIDKIRLDGEALETGAAELQGAIIDYFPFTKRPALKAALDKTHKAQGLAVAKAEAMLNGNEVEQAIQNQINQEAEKLLNHIGG